MSLSFIDANGPAIAWMSTALWMIARVSVLLAAAAIAQALIRRRTSAATRHLVWTLAVASLLLLPVLSALLPDWDVAVRVAASPVSAAAPIHEPASDAEAIASTPHGPEPGAISPAVMRPVASPAGSVTPTAAPSTLAPAAPDRAWATLFLVVYGVGAVWLLLRQAAQWLTLVRLVRRAGAVNDPEWTRLLLACARSLGVSRSVRLLRSREQTMPMAFGTRHPAIVIPAMADLWPEDRRRAVLLHELAHVARHDCLTQTWAAIACAVYWMHPGVWWVARRLRIERELACDDRVLTAGTQAREYAGHLLEIAYSLGGERASALAVSMARPRQLEGRMLAVLDVARNRATPGPRSRLAGVAMTTALLLPLALAEARVIPVGANGEPAATVSSDEPIAISTASSASAPASAAAGATTESVQERPTSEPLPGTWEIRPGKTEETVHLRLTERDSSSGFTIPVDRLEGLSAAQRSGTSGTLRFAIRRDAGTFTFEGLFRSGVGGGTFTFAPSATFPAELVKRGLARPTPADQLALARSDVGFAFLDELTTQAYPRPDLALLVRAGQHGVGLDYLRGMGGAGYRVGSLEALITLRDHGVTPDYIRELAAHGYKGLSADELRRARDHGISADYVRQMRDLGYGSLTMDALVNARDHGVSADYVRQLGELGHRKLPLEDVIRVRDHGISPEYVRELGALGHGKLSLEELVRARDHGLSSAYVREMRDLGYAIPLDQLQKARDHGVSTEFVRELADLGYRGLPLETLIRTRDHGVNPQFAREIKELGYERLELDDLVGLRDHGVTADRIRRANARAGTKLPLDMIKAMASGGLR